MDGRLPGFPVHYHLLELTQTHAHQVSDANQPSHPLPPPSPPALNLAQHQSVFPVSRFFALSGQSFGVVHCIIQNYLAIYCSTIINKHQKNISPGLGKYLIENLVRYELALT